MEIRKDLQSAEALLNRLLEYSTKLLNFNREDWVHYKNGEDFEKIYKQPYDNQIILEQIYNQGKDFAYTLGMHLQEFNDVKLYETLSKYIESFDTKYFNEEFHLAIIHEVKDLHNSLGICLWSIDRMIELYLSQIDILKAVKKTLELIKNTEIYKIENPTSDEDKNMKSIVSKKIFIVHGHDESAKLKMNDFLIKLGLQPLIIASEPSKGNTIIGKIEEYSDVAFGIILYTACDEGRVKQRQDESSRNGNSELRNRARQNVLFEHGYLIGKLGRNKVCALVKGDIEIPSDISGVLYIDMDANEGWHNKLAKELKASGLEIDINNLI